MGGILTEGGGKEMLREKGQEGRWIGDRQVSPAGWCNRTTLGGRDLFVAWLGNYVLFILHT